MRTDVIYATKVRYYNKVRKDVISGLSNVLYYEDQSCQSIRFSVDMIFPFQRFFLLPTKFPTFSLLFLMSLIKVM